MPRWSGHFLLALVPGAGVEPVNLHTLSLVRMTTKTTSI